MTERDIEVRTLALFGGTGRTGRHVLAQALDAGWRVRALARRPEALEPHPRLEVVRGDVADDRAVSEVVVGADAVLSVLGPVSGSPPDLLAGAARRITAAMREHGVHRIVSLTGGGVRDPERDRPRLPDRFIRTLLVLLQGRILRDAEQHLRVLRESGLEWTVLRAPRLTDAPRAGTYRFGSVGVTESGKRASTRIGRADLATALLDEVRTGAHPRQLPFVSE
ncbi:MAG: NAD(P)H-binding protein [Micrococcales bacterium]|nr:NAD(P)H-binding protein [Micrococcales bacterium]